MADPKPYKRGYSFTNYQADVPDKPLPGVRIDKEFDDIANASRELTQRVNAGISVDINNDALEAVAAEIDKVVFTAENMAPIRDVAALGENIERAADLFLGAFAADPTTGNNGHVLTVGATYYNTLIGESRVWDGRDWIPVAKVSTGGVLQGTIVAAAEQTEFYVGDFVSISVAKNGVTLEPGVEFVSTSPTITVPGAVEGDRIVFFAILKGSVQNAAAFVRQTVLTTANVRTYARNSANQPLNLTQTNHVLMGGAPFGMLTYGVDYSVVDGALVLAYNPEANELYHITSIPRFTNSEAQAVLQEYRDSVEDFALRAEAAAEVSQAAANFTVISTDWLKNSSQTFLDGAVLISRAESHSYEVVTNEPHLVTAGGVMLRALPAADGFVHAQQFGVDYGDRTAAAANGTAINRALEYCAAKGYGLDLGCGVIFNSVPIVQAGKVHVRGAGVSYWQKQYSGDFPAQAATAIVMVGTGGKDQTLFGVSSCASWGAARPNPSPMAGYNDNEYRLTSFVNPSASASARSLKPFSAAWTVSGQAAWGSSWNEFRIMPDAGGSDGMADVRNSDRSATKPLSSGNWDVGFLVRGQREIDVGIQAVGQWRMHGLLIAPHAKSFSLGAAGYNFTAQKSTICLLAIRSVDVAPVVATAASTVDVPWADDHPFGADGDLRLILTTGGRSGVTHTYTGMTKVTGGSYPILRFTGVNPNPTGAAYKSAMPFYQGGGSSHTYFHDCEIQGFGHGSLQPSENALLGGASPFANPKATIEISGNELTEIDFGNSAVAGYETVAVHMHDVRNVRLPRYWEMNSGGRMIGSPRRALNTFSVCGYAAAETMEVVFEPEGSTIRDGTIDMRPYITEMSPPARFNGSDDHGFFDGLRLRIPSFAFMSYADIKASAVIAPKGGRAGFGRMEGPTDFFAPTADQIDWALYYDDAASATRARLPIRSNTRGQTSVGTEGAGAFDRAVALRFVSDEITIPVGETRLFVPSKLGGWMHISAFSTEALPLPAHSGLVWFDCGSSIDCQKANIGVGGSALGVMTGNMTGTTGVDGNLTVSARNAGDIQFENRAAYPLTVRFHIS